jgi:O-antigen/teichoic acid export membrane protein
VRNKKLFLKQSFLALTVRVLGSASALIMSLLISRSLSIDDAGRFFLAFAIFTVLGTFSTFGFNVAFIRFIGGFLAENNWKVINGVFLTGLKVVGLVSVLAGILVYFFSDITNVFFPEANLSLLIATLAISIPCFALYQLIAHAFQGLHRPLLSVFFQNATITAFSVARLFSFSAFISLILCFFLWFSQAHTRIGVDNSQTSNLFQSAKPLWFVMVMNTVVQWSGQIIAGAYVDSDQIAILSIAQRLSLLVTFVLIAVNLIAAPRFAASAKLNKLEELRSTSLFCSRIMFCIALPATLLMILFSDFLLGLFGEDYIKGALMLKILVIGQFFNVICGSVGFLLSMSGHEKVFRNVVFFSGPISIILSFSLIPIFGVMGAAIATAIAVASQNLLAVFMVKKHLGFNPLNLLRQ